MVSTILSLMTCLNPFHELIDRLHAANNIIRLADLERTSPTWNVHSTRLWRFGVCGKHMEPANTSHSRVGCQASWLQRDCMSVD